MEEGTVDLGIPGVTGAVEVARGGFSTVYRATQSAMERTVAVKLIHATVVDPVAGEHFLREVRATGRLSQHPNVAPVYDVGTTPTAQPYLIMPFYEHGSLQRHLDEHGAMSERDALQMARTLATTLDYVHARGILHRDIKPANVLLTEADEPLLADFGVARLVDGSVPVHTTGANVVTWAYGPPEAFTGGEPTAAWDIYSLGATVYAMLTGNPPFVDGENVNVFTVLNRIGNVEVPDLRDRGVSAPVAEAVRRTMAKDPTERPASAAEFAGLLTRPLPLPPPRAAVVEPVVVEPEPVVVEPEPEPVVVEPEPEPVVVEAEPEPVVVEPEPVVPAEPVVADLPEPEPEPVMADAPEPERVTVAESEPAVVPPEVVPEPMAVEPAPAIAPVAAATVIAATAEGVPPAAAGGVPSEPAAAGAPPRLSRVGLLSLLVAVTVVLGVLVMSADLYASGGTVFEYDNWRHLASAAPTLALAIGLVLLRVRSGAGGEWLIGAAAAVVADTVALTAYLSHKDSAPDGTAFAFRWIVAALAVVIVVLAWREAAVPGRRIGVVSGGLLLVGAALVVLNTRDYYTRSGLPDGMAWVMLAFVLLLLVRAFAFPRRTTGAPALVVGGLVGGALFAGDVAREGFDDYKGNQAVGALVGFGLIAVVGILRWRQSRRVSPADETAA